MSRRTEDLPHEFRPLTACGATFDRRVDEEYVFIPSWDRDREGKLYARVKNGTLVYHEKRSGSGGNLSGFLEEVLDKDYLPNMTKQRRREFARSLGLPADAANGLELAYDEDRDAVVLGGRNRNGHLEDLRRLIKGQWQTTWGCKPQLLWAEKLAAAAGRAGEMWAYVCEGEKDAIALRWRLKTLDIDAIVVAVPGAGIFNEKWVSLFKGHHVRLCYDHDKPGQAGCSKAVRLLRGVAAKLEVLHWPENLRDGYDVRDWVIWALEHEVPPEKSWAGLEELFGPPVDVEEGKPARFKLLTVAEVLAQKPPPFLIEGILQAQSNTVLFAPPGAGKSFVGLAWAASIVAGVPWLGREVMQGPVLYIAAEGRAGLGLRVRALRSAWKRRGITGDLANLAFLPDAPQFLERDQADEVMRLAENLDEKVALVVIDPLARTAIGADENSTADVGRWIDAVDRLGQRLGCARLVMHHSLKSAKSVERGSSALRGAADAMFCLVDQGQGRIRLVCDKAKDFEAPEPIDLVLRGVEFSDGTSSCYVGRGIDADAVLSPTTVNRVQDRKIVSFLKSKDREQDRVAAAVAKHIRVTPNYARKRLFALISSGAVRKRREGKVDYYSLREGDS